MLSEDRRLVGIIPVEHPEERDPGQSPQGDLRRVRPQQVERALVGEYFDKMRVRRHRKRRRSRTSVVVTNRRSCWHVGSSLNRRSCCSTAYPRIVGRYPRSQDHDRTSRQGRQFDDLFGAPRADRYVRSDLCHNRPADRELTDSSRKKPFSSTPWTKQRWHSYGIQTEELRAEPLLHVHRPGGGVHCGQPAQPQLPQRKQPVQRAAAGCGDHDPRLRRDDPDHRRDDRPFGRRRWPSRASRP